MRGQHSEKPAGRASRRERILRGLAAWVFLIVVVVAYGVLFTGQRIGAVSRWACLRSLPRFTACGEH